MTKYIKSPNAISIAPDFSGISIDRVPAGYYRIAETMTGFVLVPVEPLTVPNKVYGSLLQHVPRIKEVFNERVGLPTTVMLEGLKGSGKSLMMKSLAKDFVEQEEGIVLLCNEAFAGDGFFEFLQKITQQKIVLMDEFDKVYRQDAQRNSILTLLDGTYASHTLFVLTMNASSRSESFEFFHNRPGRVFFNLKFQGVDPEAIQAYLVDCLNDQSKLAEVMQFVKRFTQFNMDMLGTLVREINAVPHLDLETIATYLNIKPDVSLQDMYFDVSIEMNGLDVTNVCNHNRVTSDYVRSFLQESSRGRGHAVTLNIESTRNVKWNVTKNIEWSDKNTDQGNDESGYGVTVRKGKKITFVPYFDRYLRGDLATVTQDPTSGAFTIEQSYAEDDDNDEACTIKFVAVPRIMKRYNYSM